MKFKLNQPTIIDLFVILFTLGLFYWIKSLGFSYRFGDSNAYFYMANQFLHGLLPYRDYLLADPPLLVILLSGLKALFGSNILLFQAVPIVLESATAILIYLEVKKKLPRLAKVFPAMYLFTFLILATSDYVTGLHFVIFFIALAYYLRKKPYLSGLFWALATLIKLYVIPGFLGWLIYLSLSKHTQQLKQTISSYILTGVIVMLPFLIIAPESVINQIIIHQFNRPEGISKTNIFTFFIIHDFILLVLTTLSFFMIKKYKTFLPLICWLVFYLIFNDLYYLYLGVLAFWIVLSLAELFNYLATTATPWVVANKQQLSTIIIFSIFLSQLIGIKIYHQAIQPQNVFSQIDEVSHYIQQLPDKPLYGSHEFVPLIALKTNHALFQDQADTNTQLFGSGALNKKELSTQAAEQGVYLLTRVANVAQNANLDQGYEGYFDQDIFEKYCQRLTIIDGSGFELFSDVAIYECTQDD